MREKPDWLAEIFPWPQRSLRVNGRSMAYVDEGARDARPVLLLHGDPTWGFLHRDFIGPLTEAGYRVIVSDCICAADSDHPHVDAALTLAHHVADLVSLIDELALGKRAARVSWRPARGRRYALELGDFGRARPSMAIVHGLWPRCEPRPPERDLDLDLIDLCLRLATVGDGLDPTHLSRVLARTPGIGG